MNMLLVLLHVAMRVSGFGGE